MARTLESIEFYLDHLRSRHIAVSSIESARRILRGFFTWFSGSDHGQDHPGKGDLRDVSLRDIEKYREFLGKLRKSDGEPTTIEHQNKQIHRIADLFRYLHRRGKILTNPCINLPPLHKPKRIPRGVITDAEVRKLLQQPNLFNPIGFRDRTLLELLYSTGLRRQEACRLTVYDIDLNERLVRVVQGKGNKDRVVPLGKVAASYVTEYLKKVRPILLARASLWKVKRGHEALRDCGALFLSKCGNALKVNHLWTLLNGYRRAAGLSSKITTHSLRHACAVEMLRGGASIRHVQEMLGHSQIDTTQIYTRLAPFDLKKVHARTSPSERRRKTDVPAFEKKAWRDNKNKW